MGGIMKEGNRRGVEGPSVLGQSSVSCICILYLYSVSVILNLFDLF